MVKNENGEDLKIDCTGNLQVTFGFGQYQELNNFNQKDNSYGSKHQESTDEKKDSPLHNNDNGKQK